LAGDRNFLLGSDISSADLTGSCDEVAAAIKKRRVVPFIGAGINMCGRTPPQFVLGSTLPNGAELATYLATRFGYPVGSSLDLARVAQYAYSRRSGPLYEALAEIFRSITPQSRCTGCWPARARPFVFWSLPITTT